MTVVSSVIIQMIIYWHSYDYNYFKLYWSKTLIVSLALSSLPQQENRLHERNQQPNQLNQSEQSDRSDWVSHSHHQYYTRRARSEHRNRWLPVALRGQRRGRLASTAARWTRSTTTTHWTPHPHWTWSAGTPVTWTEPPAPALPALPLSVSRNCRRPRRWLAGRTWCAPSASASKAAEKRKNRAARSAKSRNQRTGPAKLCAPYPSFWVLSSPAGLRTTFWPWSTVTVASASTATSTCSSTSSVTPTAPSIPSAMPWPISSSRRPSCGSSEAICTSLNHRKGFGIHPRNWLCFLVGYSLLSFLFLGFSFFFFFWHNFLVEKWKPVHADLCWFDHNQLVVRELDICYNEMLPKRKGNWYMQKFILSFLSWLIS